MKITWESLLPVMITVGGGLLLWGIKIAFNAIGNSLVRKNSEEIRELRAENESMQKQIDQNSKRIDFLIEKLIERNS